MPSKQWRPIQNSTYHLFDLDTPLCITSLTSPHLAGENGWTGNDIRLEVIVDLPPLVSTTPNTLASTIPTHICGVSWVRSLEGTGDLDRWAGCGVAPAGNVYLRAAHIKLGG